MKKYKHSNELLSEILPMQIYINIEIRQDKDMKKFFYIFILLIY